MSVLNPVIFIGETVLGGTLGAPLSTDLNGLVASGITATEVSFNSNITTTSNADVVLTGMTITPVAGTYMTWFSMWINHNTGNATVTTSIFVGGVQKTDSIRVTIPFVGALGTTTQDMTVALQGLVTVNGSQAIAIEWHTSLGTVTAHNGTLNILRIS